MRCIISSSRVSSGTQTITRNNHKTFNNNNDKTYTWGLSHHPRPIYICYTCHLYTINKGTKVRNQIRNQKQEQFELSESSKELLNTGNDIIDRSTVDKLFQSEGALNWNERLPISFCMAGTTKKGCWVFLRGYLEIYGCRSSFK